MKSAVSTDWPVSTLVEAAAPAGVVGKGGHDAGMDISMLLSEARHNR